jgi:hypothetical protein
VPSSFLSQARMRAMVRVYAGSDPPCLLWVPTTVSVSPGNTAEHRLRNERTDSAEPWAKPEV